jgi:hypothetical protein
MIYFIFSSVIDGPLFSHVRHELVHTLLLLSLANAELLERGPEEVRGAVAVALDLLKGGLQ